MEASSNQQQKEKEPRVHRPYAFDKMEGLVREMQDPENGVPVSSQRQFLTSIPAAFMGYDLIEWLMERLAIDDTAEALHIANQLCQYGYFFPVNDSKTPTVKGDSSLYRFQTPYYWPWQHRTPDNVEYAIYLAKRTLRNRQRHALEEYETEALNSLRKNLQNKWGIIQLQAEEQVRLLKDSKKEDKIISDSQERAFWRIYRPPPGCVSSLEVVPVPTRFRPGLPRPPSRKRTLTDLQREVELLRNSLTRTRIKVSTAIENIKSYYETYMEYDPIFTQPLPSNPWINDDQTFWQLNNPYVDVPTEKRVKRWALSMEELMSDPTGLAEFTNYLEKEYSHENIRFWLEVKDLRRSFQAQINDKVMKIFRNFLAPGAPCEINIDGKTMEKVNQEMRNPSRFTFDSAAEHVYTLLLKKDCYPRFIRSDHYRNLLAAGVQPMQKKRFFGFGGQVKKKLTSSNTTSNTLQQQHTIIGSSTCGRRRGSDRSLSGSAHELAICGVRDISSAPKVPHSHSQSNLTDIPYRGDLARLVKIASRPIPCSVQDTGQTDDVCPWEAAAGPSGSVSTSTDTDNAPVGYRASRKSSSQMDSCSSSSDVSLAVTEATDRLRKSCSLQHASMGSSVDRTSTIKAKLSETTRASISTCNYTTPQQSFEQGNVGKTLLREPRAPLISISAIVGELPEISHKEHEMEKDSEIEEEEKEVEGEGDKEEDTKVKSAEDAQVVPVWTPDSQPADAAMKQPVPFENVSADSKSHQKRDNDVNEVCPWEDEENCRVDAPYVKTYATLGYL